MLLRKFYTEIKSCNRQLYFHPEVLKNHPDGTIPYESINSLTEKMIPWSPKRALPKIFMAKFIKHYDSHILLTDE